MEAIALVQAALAAWENNKKPLLMHHLAPHEAFPDWSFNATEFTQCDDTITIITQQSGTHLGMYSCLLPNYPGIPATGKTFKLPVRQLVFRLYAGKIIELTAEGSSKSYGVAMFQQLGIILPDAVAET